MTVNRRTVNTVHSYEAVYGVRTDDLGTVWSGPTESTGLSRRTETVAGIDDVTVAVADLVPQWHAPSETLLLIGITFKLEDGAQLEVGQSRETIYSTYDPNGDEWGHGAGWRCPTRNCSIRQRLVVSSDSTRAMGRSTSPLIATNPTAARRSPFSGVIRQ
jgi:hypothetical protein